MKKLICTMAAVFILQSSVVFPTSHAAAASKEIDVTVTYKVKEGDSLYKLSKKSQTTVSKLMTVNKLESDKLSIGQILEIPVKDEDTFQKLTGLSYTEVVKEPEKKTLSTVDTAEQKINVNSTIYAIKKGDSIDSIAKKFKISTKQILLVNPQIKDPNVISIGQAIIIPLPK